MAEVTWGRKETIIWPPRKPIYTLGALFLGLIATGFFVYFRFLFVLSPLQQFYLPAYIKSTVTASVPIHTKYRMLLMSDQKTSCLVRTRRGCRTGLDTTAGRQAPSASIVRFGSTTRHDLPLSERAGLSLWDQR